MMWRRLLLGILGLAVVIAVGWFVLTPSRSAVRSAGETAGKEDKGPRAEHAETTAIAITPEKRQALGLKVEPVAARVPQATLNLTGKIVANPDRTVVVAPRTPGRVVKVNAQLGDTVDAGATLALVDSAEAADALAELAQGDAALALAQADQERETLLVERKIGARKDLLKAEAVLQQARAQRNRARDRLYLLGFTDTVIAQAQQQPGHRPLTPLTAPFRGTVIERQVTEGQLLDASAVPFRVADLSTVWALVDVPESDITRIRVGQMAVIEAGRDAALSYTGRISFIGNAVEEQTRTVKVRVEIPNRERHFKPGMFVTARLTTTSSGPGVLMVPKNAVVLLDDGFVVFVDQGEALQPRPVEVGPEADGWVPILKGLAAGEKIVTEGAFTLKAQIVKAKLGEE